jgi:hypothetical protein
MRKHNNVFKEEVKNRKEIRAKAFFTSSLKMKQPKGVSSKHRSQHRWAGLTGL